MTTVGSSNVDTPNIADITSIYQELYSEMRRYRDKQLDFVRWFTTVALAFVAGIFALSQGAQGTDPIHETRYAILILLSVLGSCVAYLVIYMDRRYAELRQCVKAIEPKWRTETKRRTRLKPSHVLVFLIGFITVVVVVIVLTI